jgi:hypothetical protein
LGNIQWWGYVGQRFLQATFYNLVEGGRQGNRSIIGSIGRAILLVDQNYLDSAPGGEGIRPEDQQRRNRWYSSLERRVWIGRSTSSVLSPKTR